MDRNSRSGTAAGTGTSPPSAAWLFAQALLGKSVPSASQSQADAQAEREQLEWLASISPEHERRLRCQLSEEADARAQREQLEWLAKISPRHESQLRSVLGAEAEAAEAQEYMRWLTEGSHAQEAQWDPSKHPRGAFPQNPGWWSPTGGASGGPPAVGAVPPIQTASYRADRSPMHVIKVSGKARQLDEPGGSSTASGAPSTRTQLPADHRGTWVSGTRGHGVFHYNDSLENQQAGLAGKKIRFENQHIAIGGFPPESYYRGSAGSATVEIESVTATNADSLAADAAMRKKLGNPEWQRPEGYRWNHAGQPGSKVMELVDTGVHSAVAHKGPGAALRAQRRAANAQGATGRAMGVLTVYLYARDTLQTGGLLKPDYEVAEREAYHFRAEDGSVFVVQPGGLFSSAERQFVDGPRKGQTEKISNAEVEEYRKQAEEEFGKYIPGSLFSEPRFVPGRQRTSLPLIIYKYGLPHDAGWIDEKGVHYYSIPRIQPI